MKELYRPASMALLAFMGLAGLSACSSDDDASVDPSPSVGEAVKTTFTLSVGIPQGTRVSEDVAQAQTTPKFRGIDNITLIPFGLAGSTTVDVPVLATSQRLGLNINLPGSTANVFEAQNTPYNKVYANVSLPQGTTAFLFYGKAIDGSVNNEPADDKAKHQYGTLTAAGLNQQPQDITFTPVQVNNMTAAPTQAVTIANYLTKIAQSSATFGDQTVAWSAQNNDNNPFYNLYEQFIQNQSGASNDIQLLLQALYKSLQPSYNSNALAKAISDNITSEATVDAQGNLTLNASVAGYPENLDNQIPEGVALVSWDGTSNSFTPNISGSTTDGELTTKPSDLVYPANLQYYVNTNISTSNTDQSQALNTATNWDQTLTANLTSGGQVTPSTQTVALKKQIQYAVARLDITMKQAASLKDHAGKTVNGAVGDNGSFPISAIFVGGQRPVKFDFTPTGTGSDVRQYTIYDNVGPDNWYAATSTATPAVAHTLALETPAKEKVRVAVELTNKSGQDFTGADGGLIYNGAKFYLIAELDPAATSGVTRPDGTTSLDQVFKQDYTTKANLTIGANDNGGQNGLGAAYNILPDLRNPQLSLGLSVNLEWQTGLTFDITM